MKNMDTQPKEILEKIFLLAIDYKNLSTMRGSVSSLRVSRRWRSIINGALKQISEIGGIDIQCPVSVEEGIHHFYWGKYPVFFQNDLSASPSISTDSFSIYIINAYNRSFFAKHLICLIGEKRYVHLINKKLELITYTLPKNIKDKLNGSRVSIEETIHGPLLMIYNSYTVFLVSLREEVKIIRTLINVLDPFLYTDYLLFKRDNEGFLHLLSFKNWEEVITFPSKLFTPASYDIYGDTILIHTVITYFYNITKNEAFKKVDNVRYRGEVLVTNQGKVFDSEKGDCLCSISPHCKILSTYKEGLKYHLIV